MIDIPCALDRPKDAILNTPEWVRLRLDVIENVGDFSSKLVIKRHRRLSVFTIDWLLLDRLALSHVPEPDWTFRSVDEATTLATLVTRFVVLCL